MHPVSLLTPRPVKRAKRAVRETVNPYGAMEDAVERAAVRALRGSGRRRSSSGRSGSSYASGFGRGYLTQRERAAVERQRKEAERERTYRSAVDNERALVELHLVARPPATPTVLPPADPVDRAALWTELAAETGLSDLETELGHPLERPIAPAAEPVSPVALEPALRQKHLQGIRWYRRSDRARARLAAIAEAGETAKRLTIEREQECRKRQQQLDADWTRLEIFRAELAERVKRLATEEEARREADRVKHQKFFDSEWERLQRNEPGAVAAALTRALQDLGPRAFVGSVRGDRPVLVARLPRLADLPDQKPEVTPGGKLTLKRRSKTELNDLHLRASASVMLAAVRASFAAVPRLAEVTVLGARPRASAADGVEAVYLGTFMRHHFDGFRWEDVYLSSAVLHDAQDIVVNLRGRTHELVEIKLPDDPAVAEAMDRASTIIGALSR